MPHNLDCPSAALILSALHCCGSDLLTELPHFLTISCSSLLLCRRSTRWWALWSWWKWTKMAWRLSRGWTRSSPRWIRTTTTRSRWKSSKRQPRVTRPSYYCCSVTSRNRRVERSTSRHGLHRKLFHVPFSLQLFPLKTKQNKTNKKTTCLDYLSMDLLLVFETLVCMRMLLAIKKNTRNI